MKNWVLKNVFFSLVIFKKVWNVFSKKKIWIYIHVKILSSRRDNYYQVKRIKSDVVECAKNKMCTPRVLCILQWYDVYVFLDNNWPIRSEEADCVIFFFVKMTIKWKLTFLLLIGTKFCSFYLPSYYLMLITNLIQYKNKKLLQLKNTNFLFFANFLFFFKLF